MKFNEINEHVFSIYFPDGIDSLQAISLDDDEAENIEAELVTSSVGKWLSAMRDVNKKWVSFGIYQESRPREALYYRVGLDDFKKIPKELIEAVENHEDFYIKCEETGTEAHTLAEALGIPFTQHDKKPYLESSVYVEFYTDVGYEDSDGEYHWYTYGVTNKKYLPSKQFSLETMSFVEEKKPMTFDYATALLLVKCDSTVWTERLSDDEIPDVISLYVISEGQDIKSKGIPLSIALLLMEQGWVLKLGDDLCKIRGDEVQYFKEPSQEWCSLNLFLLDKFTIPLEENGYE
jgi:hypothetical protein